MKIRTNYVSNSSSSSFLVAYNDISAFDSIKKYKGYKEFISDVEGEACDDESKVKDFFVNKYHEILDSYMWNVRDRNILWKKESPTDEFKALCRKFGCEDDEDVQDAYIEGVQNVELNAEAYCTGAYYDYDEFEPLATKFADLLYEKMKQKFKNVSSFSYSDNDGDFYAYMEHDFMQALASDDDDKYAVLSINNH